MMIRYGEALQQQLEQLHTFNELLKETQSGGARFCGRGSMQRLIHMQSVLSLRRININHG